MFRVDGSFFFDPLLLHGAFADLCPAGRVSRGLEGRETSDRQADQWDRLPTSGRQTDRQIHRTGRKLGERET
jgi:hypothetical protein